MSARAEWMDAQIDGSVYHVVARRRTRHRASTSAGKAPAPAEGALSSHCRALYSCWCWS